MCSSMKKKKSKHFTTETNQNQTEKHKQNKNSKTKKTDKTAWEISSDLIHRPELQKKAIHPSAMHDD